MYVTSGWAGWVFAYPEFGSPVNPFPTRGADYAHHLGGSPRFLDVALLQPWLLKASHHKTFPQQEFRKVTKFGIASSNVVGIICLPSWNRNNYLPKNLANSLSRAPPHDQTLHYDEHMLAATVLLFVDWLSSLHWTNLEFKTFLPTCQFINIYYSNIYQLFVWRRFRIFPNWSFKNGPSDSFT